MPSLAASWILVLQKNFSFFFSGHFIRRDVLHHFEPDVRGGRGLADPGRIPDHCDRGALLLHVP